MSELSVCCVPARLKRDALRTERCFVGAGCATRARSTAASKNTPPTATAQLPSFVGIVPALRVRLKGAA